MERRDHQGVTVSDIAETHDDHYTKPPLGSLRRVAGDVWKALNVMEPDVAVNAVSPDPFTMEITVKLDSLFVGPFRRRRLRRLVEAVGNAACARNTNIDVRFEAAAWRSGS